MRSLIAVLVATLITITAVDKASAAAAAIIMNENNNVAASEAAAANGCGMELLQPQEVRVEFFRFYIREGRFFWNDPDRTMFSRTDPEPLQQHIKRMVPRPITCVQLNFHTSTAIVLYR